MSFKVEPANMRKFRRRSYLDPNIHDTLKPRGGRGRTALPHIVQRKVARIAHRYDVDTQRIRTGLILQLEALAEMAQQKAIDTHPASEEAKQNWTRLAAYVSQVINSISKTYDEIKIDADLAELERLVTELSTKEQNEKAQQE